jgi:hypothetical protein
MAFFLSCLDFFLYKWSARENIFQKKVEKLLQNCQQKISGTCVPAYIIFKFPIALLIVPETSKGFV